MQSTTYHGREYVREVFNESTNSKINVGTPYTLCQFCSISEHEIFLSLLNSQFLKVEMKSRFCTICMQCIIHNAGSVLALKNLHQRVFATMWQKNNSYYYRYVTKVENRLVVEDGSFIIATFLN